jgi:hypothetical protein
MPATYGMCGNPARGAFCVNGFETSAQTGVVTSVKAGTP